MPTYLYELAHTAESLKAQIQNPQDRLEAAARPLIEKAGGKLLGGGYSFGDYDVVILYEVPDDETAAAVAMAVGAGGAISRAKTTKLLSGQQWVGALNKAKGAAAQYQPAR